MHELYLHIKFGSIQLQYDGLRTDIVKSKNAHMVFPLQFILDTSWFCYLLHRIVTGGFCGKKGAAINFVTEDDHSTLKKIEEVYNAKIMEMPSNVADLYSEHEPEPNL